MSRRRRVSRPAPSAVTPDVRGIIREELSKALQLPRGAVAQPVSASYLAALGQHGRPGHVGSAAALPRDPAAFTVGFGPGVPLLPAPLDPTLPTGRPAPRLSEYPVSANLQLVDRHTPWTVLRDVADQVPLVRRCIEVRKSSLVGMEWAFTVDPTRVARAATTEGLSRTEMRNRLAEKHADTIARLQTFWARPDRVSGWKFAQWLGAVLEEQMVLDAVAVYPHPKLNGELHSFELIDGATIKPLIDYRGATPQPPYPAYQQVLQGFPRGEFVAGETVDREFVSAVYGRPNLAGVARSDALVYERRYTRVNSPYGLPPTEQALADIDLWLLRVGWLRSEYATGVTPEMIVRVDSPMTPEQLRAYETVFNDELQGRRDSPQRHRARFLPAGFTESYPPGVDAKFNSDLDLHLMRLVCNDFDVLPSEIGIVPPTGLGGKGWQEGEENSAGRRGIKPLASWVIDLINDLSRAWLDMPDEITFQFLGLESEDEERDADIRNGYIATGLKTINEGRDELNLPRFQFDLADQPFLATGSGPIYFTDLQEQHDQPAPAVPPTPPGQVPQPQQDPGEAAEPAAVPGGPPPPGAAASATPARAGDARAEAVKFLRYTRRRAGQPWRDFEFAAWPDGMAAAANHLARHGEVDAVKALLLDGGDRG